jgi:FkbH-like protein
MLLRDMGGDVMKLREALELIQKPRSGRQDRYLLGCSSTPAHLQTFLRASLMLRCPNSDVQIDTTTYGDLLGSLEGVRVSGYAGVAVICEWYDLDPRLGFRRLGGWVPSGFDDIVETVQAGFWRLRSAVERLADAVPVVIALPTLPLPPLEIAAPAQALGLESRLWVAAWNFAEWCISRRSVRLLSPAELDRRSPHAERFDLRTEIGQGSPYRLVHASTVAELMSSLLAPSAPLKGLITDLDDTLWHGILGEVGTAGVGFTLDAGAQIHGLYQQFLQSLAERGILLGIASKNEPSLVKQTLDRTDLIVRRESFFPVEVHWGPKSESVGRILNAWNIGPEAVAFIDDSAIEGAEVQARFPQMRYLAFPVNEPARLLEFFDTLRHWFGKAAIQPEDRLRAHSIRSSAVAETAPADPAAREAFLAGLEARLSFELTRDTADERAFELINKTNQFNLNGRRITEAGWRGALAAADSFLVTARYTDKFGPLGKIAVVLGERRGSVAALHSWVMSCRAFSRRIEYATLQYLFERLDVETIALEFDKTERNGPVQEFLASLAIPDGAPEIRRSDFQIRCPGLPHALEEITADA